MDVTIWLQIQKGADMRSVGKEGEEEEEGGFRTCLAEQPLPAGGRGGSGQRRKEMGGQEWGEDLALDMIALEEHGCPGLPAPVRRFLLMTGRPPPGLTGGGCPALKDNVAVRAALLFP